MGNVGHLCIQGKREFDDVSEFSLPVGSSVHNAHFTIFTHGTPSFSKEDNPKFWQSLDPEKNSGFLVDTYFHQVLM
jgi:hypothetical protein